MAFILNPKRRNLKSFNQRLKYYFQFIFVRFGLWCGFTNIEYSYIHGDRSKLFIGEGCSTANAIFNLNSGEIHIGNDTIFTHSCMVLTGTHRFYKGKRAKLQANAPFTEVPDEGRDIHIGSGCFIGSGTIITGDVTIGDNVIICAGSVVTKDIPSNCFATGFPAEPLKFHKR